MDGSSALNSAEIYDPASGVWTMVANMDRSRQNHTANLLDSGLVLVASGTTSELYDPAANTWLPAADLNDGLRFIHTGTLLADGRVLVAGGTGSGALDSAEIYTP